MPAPEVSYPPGYPLEWEADVLLADGAVARLRPIRPDDAELLVDFYARVSPESKYLRFFAPYPRLSARDVARFTQIDYVDRVAFIVITGGQDEPRMLAVGRYERLADDRAEVAFLVEDAHQGRGIAQLLLEHLAEAARERGITGFTAEVLPENRRMAQVFADAGYRVQRGIEDGVLLVEFPILPTDTSVGVMERREHRAEGASMQRLLTPEHVVLHGPGARIQEVAHALLRGGFRGRVSAVSSDEVTVNGVRQLPSLARVTERIDLVLLAIPAQELGAVVIDAAHKGAHGMVVLAGSDFGPEDNKTVINLARAYGIRALGPDALGLINTDPDVALNASPGPMPRVGGIGLFCQSAANGVGLLGMATEQQLGISSFISTGDVADVTANDVMQFWEDDEATRVCLLSLDRIGNPRKFSRIVRRLARRKPVVVFAPGQARRSAYSPEQHGLSHAPEAAVDALFRQSGVIVVHRRQSMLDIAQVLARQPLPTGVRVRVITNSGSLAQQLGRHVRSTGLLTAGPVQVTRPTESLEQIAVLARAAMADPECDSVLCAVVGVFTNDAAGGPERTRAALTEVALDAGKPLVTSFLDFTATDEADPEHADPEHADRVRADRLREDRAAVDRAQTLAVIDGPIDAVDALAAMTAYAHWRDRDPGAVPLLDTDEAAGRRTINRVLRRMRPEAPADPETSHAGRLTARESTELLAAYGISLVPRQDVRTVDEAVAAGAAYGWDVVLKGSSSAFRGRPDLASVFRHIANEAEMRLAWRDLEVLVHDVAGPAGSAARPGELLTVLLAEAAPVVQPMVAAGVSLVLASTEDAAFGPIVSVGLEGIASELLGDIVYRVPPLTTVDAAAMVRDLRAAEVLFGRNGSPPVDVRAVEELLHRLAQLADDQPQLESVVLSPCIASTDGVAVLGAEITVAEAGVLQRDPTARSLS